MSFILLLTQIDVAPPLFKEELSEKRRFVVPVELDHLL